MGLAFLAVGALLYAGRTAVPLQRRILGAMNLFFGVAVGTMAFGHLLAVTTKLVLGTLEGSLTMFYAIGIALAVPSWWLIYHACRIATPAEPDGRRTVALNVWLGMTLLALGLPNVPLAAPAILNVGYQMSRGRRSGWAIVGVAVLLNVGMFVGSLVFFASGQSFEDFSGMPQ
jgi:hypothetical protein